jgi:hypothetical protein
LDAEGAFRGAGGLDAAARAPVVINAAGRRSAVNNFIIVLVYMLIV